MDTRTKIIIANICSTFSFTISFLILLVLLGCKFSIKEYTSSIGEMAVEPIHK